MAGTGCGPRGVRDVHRAPTAGTTRTVVALGRRIRLGKGALRSPAGGSPHHPVCRPLEYRMLDRSEAEHAAEHFKPQWRSCAPGPCTRSRPAPGEALAGLLCEAMERGRGVSRRAFAHLRATAPAVLAEASDTRAGSREETPDGLRGARGTRGRGGRRDGGRRGRLEDGARALRGRATARAARPSSSRPSPRSCSTMRRRGRAPVRWPAVLIEARSGLRYWETDEAPYVLELCEGAELCPPGHGGGRAGRGRAHRPRGAPSRRCTSADAPGSFEASCAPCSDGRCSRGPPGTTPRSPRPGRSRPAPGRGAGAVGGARRLHRRRARGGDRVDARSPRPVGRVRRRGCRAQRTHRRRPSPGARRCVCGGPAGTHPGRGPPSGRGSWRRWRSPWTTRGPRPLAPCAAKRPAAPPSRSVPTPRCCATSRGTGCTPPHGGGGGRSTPGGWRVWTLRTAPVETMRLSDVEMERLARGRRKGRPGGDLRRMGGLGGPTSG